MTSLRAVAYQGAVAPEGFAVTCGRGETQTDLTTATAATMRVKKPSGATVTWAASLSGATTTSVVATHVYAAGDLDEKGRYAISVHLSVPGGTIRTEPKSLLVLDEFQVDGIAFDP